jgi:hypothetical protein
MRIDFRLQMIPCVIMLLLAGGTMASGQIRISSSVIGSGATDASGGGFRVMATVGQPVIGRVQSATIAASQGFWYTLPQTVSAVEEPLAGATADRVALLVAGPNPFNDNTELRLELPTSGDVSLKLYDGLGREVRTLVDGHRGAGTIAIHVDGNDLPSGRYTAMLVAGPVRQSIVLTVVR